MLERQGLDKNAYLYLSGYANYCFTCFEEYLKCGETGEGDIAKYLEAFEDAIAALDNGQRIAKSVPLYEKLKNSAEAVSG